MNTKRSEETETMIKNRNLVIFDRWKNYRRMQKIF